MEKTPESVKGYLKVPISIEIPPMEFFNECVYFTPKSPSSIPRTPSSIPGISRNGVFFSDTPIGITSFDNLSLPSSRRLSFSEDSTFVEKTCPIYGCPDYLTLIRDREYRDEMERKKAEIRKIQKQNKIIKEYSDTKTGNRKSKRILERETKRQKK